MYALSLSAIYMYGGLQGCVNVLGKIAVTSKDRSIASARHADTLLYLWRLNFRSKFEIRSESFVENV